ncbi:MAG TPA: PEGA domain-containing protein [Candidatus Omnitrophota bacterium]|jgi:hypothetical protein|nr:PEGA domain-containing protein [Candidatus Omnitrophota bacterium]
MLILRKILFYLFLAIYLALCPVLVLYSLGYIYAPKSEEGIVKTGLIHLESLPPGASVHLDQKLLAEKTPCTLSSLLPGEHSVTVSLNAHRSWSAQAQVEAGKASVFDHVLLLPETIKSEVLVRQRFKELSRIPATRFLLLNSSGRLGGVTVFDWKNNDLKPLVPGGLADADEEIQRVFTVKRSPHALILTKGNGASRYLWFDLRGETPARKDISRLFRNGAPRDVQWEGARPGFLFAFYEDRLDRLDPDANTVNTHFIGKIKGFGVHRGKVYGLRKASLFRVNADARRPEETEVDGGRFLTDLFREDDSYGIDFLTGDKVLFRGRSGSLLANRLPYQFVEEGLAGYSPDEDLEKVLVWTRKEIGLLDFEKTVPAGALFERGIEIDWFYQKGTAIRKAFFVYGTSHVIFNNEDTVFLMETSARETRPVGITRIPAGSDLFFAEKTGKLYHLDPETGYFMATEILPAERILERVFQEAEGSREAPAA